MATMVMGKILLVAAVSLLPACAQTSYSPAEVAQVEMDITRKCATNHDQWVREMCHDTLTRQKIAEVQQARAEKAKWAAVAQAAAQGMQDYSQRQHELAVAAASRPIIIEQPQVIHRTQTNCWRTGNNLSCQTY